MRSHLADLFEVQEAAGNVRVDGGDQRVSLHDLVPCAHSVALTP